jgi:hypothetical protein
MFLRSIHRKKDGKDHRYFSIVENQRIASDKTVQRTVRYLGEINDQQQATWRKTLSVFDDEQQEYANLSLFPDDREIPADAVDSLQVKLSGLEMRRPRLFGSCWLGCQLWQQLGLDDSVGIPTPASHRIHAAQAAREPQRRGKGDRLEGPASVACAVCEAPSQG